MGLDEDQQANIPIDVVPIVVSVINTIIPKIIIKLVREHTKRVLACIYLLLS